MVGLQAAKVAQTFRISSELTDDGRTRIYRVEGQVFFASTKRFASSFDFKEALDRVVINVGAAHIWDLSRVAALDRVILKFRREGAGVEVLGLNEASSTIVDKLALHDKPGAMDGVMGH